MTGKDVQKAKTDPDPAAWDRLRREDRLLRYPAYTYSSVMYLRIFSSPFLGCMLAEGTVHWDMSSSRVQIWTAEEEK